MRRTDHKTTRKQEALAVLTALGLPRQQQNDRSAHTLLALLNLPAHKRWSEASNPLLGVTEIMGWIAEHYGVRYAPNTRETIRRQTIHQFEQAALIAKNPDEPTRPINSPRTVYQISPAVLDLLRNYSTPGWKPRLAAFSAEVETLQNRYAQVRDKHAIPLEVAPGHIVALSAGGQNVLVKQIVERFAPLFTPGARLLYLGDAQAKQGYFDKEAFRELGLFFDMHGQMPDVAIHDTDRNWLVLVEAVTSHGPVDPKRLLELKALFASSTAGLVFVTAFPDRHTFRGYLAAIAWETEVWIAEDPTHMIHFNGERFLGPYPAPNV